MKIELNALIKEWASYNINLRNLSENSVKAYSLDLKDFLHFTFRESQAVLKSDLSNISSHKFRLWILSLRNRSVKASSLSRKISSLKNFFQWLENSHNIFNAAISNLDFPKKDKNWFICLSTNNDGEITPIAITIPGAAYPILEKFVIKEIIFILKTRLVKIINVAKEIIINAPKDATLKLLKVA